MNTAVDITDPWADVADEYVVDGRDLLRVVSLPDRARGLRTAVLEDCRTLELRLYRIGKLRRLRRLSRVRGTGLRGSEPITGTG